MESKKPVEALIAASKKDKALDGPVYLQISLSSSAVDKRQSHPILIPLPHKFRRQDESMVCLVVKDPSSPISADLDRDPQTRALFDEVIGVGKLRRRVAGGKKTGKTTKQVEEFAKAFALICVQDKVAEPLTEVMGLGYLKRGRHLPIRVNLGPSSGTTEESRKQLKFVVKAALRSAQLILRPDAPLSSVRVGHTRMDKDKLAANVDAAIKQAKQRIPKGLGTTAQYYLKTPESLALKVD